MTTDGGAQAGELIEQLAAIEHERWSSWQRWMHDQCVRDDDGSLTIPAGLVSRWERQIDTPYADLTEREKESDREQVRRYWPLIEAIISERDHLAAQVAALTAERERVMAAFRDFTGDVAHFAQTVHQAHHADHDGTWLSCPRGVCPGLWRAFQRADAATTPPAGAQEGNNGR